ncbi:hypothetical protein [Microlunatus sp. Gsoil 973]|uniref:hypothetical protein n=1 Tax=Microlunatus sp. Gsoil 973 TaxID=2672569 RepID=UPI001E601489|nr:hypothetical protein [Microlunatus sp. Gsoil 973]
MSSSITVASVRNTSRTPEGWDSTIASWGSATWRRAHEGSRCGSIPSVGAFQLDGAAHQFGRDSAGDHRGSCHRLVWSPDRCSGPGIGLRQRTIPTRGAVARTTG